MAEQTRTTLKGYFETNDVPTQSNFEDLIDSIGAMAVDDNITSIDRILKKSVTANITASSTQTQGEQQLTSDINEISIVAAANDVVTLPSAEAGLEIFVINNDSNTLQIFPAVGDNLGAGLNLSTPLISGDVVTFVAYDDTNWITKA